jgi:hypothetical protein
MPANMISSGGRVEHQIYAWLSVVLLLVEVKVDCSQTADYSRKCMAQVIAELLCAGSCCCKRYPC